MILIDLSQIIYSNIFQNKELEEDLIRSMIFSSLLSYKKQFSKDFGNPILALDSKDGYWRKDIFEHYKIGRKIARDKSKEDWEKIFKIVNTITKEIEECLPWKIIKVSKAEADDIIATLTLEFGDEHPTLILSSDKDYKQLHFKKNVKQYSPIMKKWIKTDDAEKFLKELIIMGDAGDGIPNIRSDEDTFISEKRQKPITKKFLEEFFSNPGKIYFEHKNRYDLNEKLIDFKKIPEEIKEKILDEYEKPISGSLNKLYNLFVSKKMSRSLENIQNFKLKEHDYGIYPRKSLFR